MAKDRERSKFGRALEDILDRHAMKRSEAVERLEVSRAYFSAVVTGRKGISPDRIDSLSQHLEFDDDEVRRLHRAAAQDAGFRLDLPDDF